VTPPVCAPEADAPGEVCLCKAYPDDVGCGTQRFERDPVVVGALDVDVAGPGKGERLALHGSDLEIDP